MSKDWMFTFIFILSIQNSQSDLGLIKFKTELGNWTKDMPKVWHNYIKMYLYRIYTENKTQLAEDNVRNILSKLQNTTESLLIFSNQIRLNLQWFSMCLDSWGKGFSWHNETEGCFVKWEVGHFFLSTKNLVYPYFRCTHSLKCAGFAFWKFDPKLRLNLTFLSFYLYGGSFRKLIVIQGIVYHRCYEESENDFIFEGQYSTFYFYSNSRMLTICILQNEQELFTQDQIVGMFMIFDRDLLINVHLTKEKIVFRKYWWYWDYYPNIFPIDKFKYNFNNKYELFRYYISVRKLARVIIKNITSKHHGFLVFDGPGYLSPTMNATKNVIITSTFQCLVLVFLTGDKMTNNEQFKFISKTLSTDNIVINVTNTSMFNIPQLKCMKNVYISLFLAESGYEVNITAIVVKSTNPYNINCLYAGLVTGERVANDYKESKTICEVNSVSRGQSISFYSSNSSLILVMYWYKKYSEIDASVMVSQTKCKPVIINPCHFNTFCLEYIPKCQSYLDKVTRFSSINLKVQSKDSVIYEGNFGKCSILQISSMPTEFPDIFVPFKNRYVFLKSCSLTLTPNQTVDISIKLSIQKSDVIVIERKKYLCKSTNFCLKNISEPLISRMMKYKESKSDYNTTTQDASLKINFNSLTTTSWIELIILPNLRSSSDHSPIRRFAMDFYLNPAGINIHSDFPSINMISSLLMFMFSAKILDFNVSVTVDLIARIIYVNRRFDDGVQGDSGVQGVYYVIVNDLQLQT